MRYKTGTRVTVRNGGLDSGKRGVVIPPRLDSNRRPVTTNGGHPYPYHAGRDAMIRTDSGDVLCYDTRYLSREDV